MPATQKFHIRLEHSRFAVAITSQHAGKQGRGRQAEGLQLDASRERTAVRATHPAAVAAAVARVVAAAVAAAHAAHTAHHHAEESAGGHAAAPTAEAASCGEREQRERSEK